METDHDWIFDAVTMPNGLATIRASVPMDEPVEDYEGFADTVTSIASSNDGSIECELYSHGDQLDHRLVVFFADGTCRVENSPSCAPTRDFVAGLSS